MGEISQAQTPGGDLACDLTRQRRARNRASHGARRAGVLEPLYLWDYRSRLMKMSTAPQVSAKIKTIAKYSSIEGIWLRGTDCSVMT
jgi:hypothetical protein